MLKLSSPGKLNKQERKDCDQLEETAKDREKEVRAAILNGEAANGRSISARVLNHVP